jgi:GR25 family glycosyltransferase involved in LPS biosynthesis
MRIYVVNCDRGRAERIWNYARPLDLEMVMIPSPLSNDPEVVRRGKRCLEHSHSYPGGIAATLGHIRAMQSFLKSTDPLAMIVEDDVRFHRDFHRVNKCVERYMLLNPEVDIVSVGFCNPVSGQAEDIEPGIPVVKRVEVSNPYGAQAYIITRAYAQKFTTLFSADDIYTAWQGNFVTDQVIFDTRFCRRDTMLFPYVVEEPGEQTIAGNNNKHEMFHYLGGRDVYFM